VTLPLRVAYSPEYLLWQLGAGHPTNPIRAKLAVELLEQLVPDMIVYDATVGTKWGDLERDLGRVHDPNYVDRVLTDGDLNGEADPDADRMQLSVAALSMFNGTRLLVEELIREDMRAGVSFNPQGAKHHAMWDHAAGFCAFNDMAWAAERLVDEGHMVGYLDWDAHAGDGVQHLTKELDAVVTFSIHQGGIFPTDAAVLKDDAGRHVYNRVLQRGDGDAHLLRHVREAMNLFRDEGVDVVLLAAGADGLEADPLTGLRYTQVGLIKAAHVVGRSCALRGVPIVVGGAGGYLAENETPKAWAGVITQLHQEYSRLDEALHAARRGR
jgi:acetoin utilization protein AcuC